MSTNAFRLIAPPFTPFDSAGELNVAVVPDYADWLSEMGVDGVFVAGSTGESASLSTHERRNLAAAWADVAADRFEFIIHVGHNSLPDARQLAAHAASVGADAIAVHAPCYFKPQTTAALVEFCQAVAEAAPDVPFYYYDIPILSGVSLPMVAFAEQALENIPTFRGLKYTNPDLVQLQELLGAVGDCCDILFGCDEILLAGYTFGTAGAVGSTYNFAAPHYRQMLAAMDSGDVETARRLQGNAVQFIDRLKPLGFIPAAKQVMSSLGVDCGRVRLPLVELTADQQAEVDEAMKAFSLGPAGKSGMTQPTAS